jgi:outer membrane receptor protein involved in Fe transport
MNLALYYIKVNDIQLTTFVTSGQGRLLDNYGSAQSQGLDLSVHARLTNKLFAHLNYGYAHATFLSDVINENNENIKGNQLPYAPKHTLAAGVNYIVPVKSPIVDQVKLNANYRAAGPIYWTNDQTVKQPLYGILDLNASASRKNFTLTAYVKNLTNTGYAAFFFQAFNQNFAQKGTPRQLGLELSLKY